MYASSVTAPKARSRRTRGGIDTLPSGALRVRVYAGVDPLTKRGHYLTEVIPAGPQAHRQAEKARTRLLSQVDEQRSPRTRATVNQLMDKYLEMLDIEPTTRRAYIGYIDKHIRPLLGPLMVGRLDAEVLDSFYLRLRTCRDHCGGRKQVDHRTTWPHDCRVIKHHKRTEHDCDVAGCRVIECRPHVCQPLGASTIRQIHWILSGALKRAVRWRWIAHSPTTQADLPSSPTPNPQPPTADEAAVLANEAWKDPDWGAFVWLAMTTGARRGELCALRWSDIDFDDAVITLRASIAQDGRLTWEKDTKTHQQRRVALGPETIEVLREHYDRAVTQAAAIGVTLPAEAFMFSQLPDGSTHLVPDSVGQRYSRMAARLGLSTHLHSLRHYSATELIAVGFDVRTIAGRLGHGGGGTTTLRVYAAWVSEVDQRAASALEPRMPPRPARE
ncbi:MAG: site-specific integrase [Actinomycetota bacterium]|nr:site-specific integrase [Actinomycetota bacterium]